MDPYEPAEFADAGDKITNTLTINDNGDGGTIGIRSRTADAFGPQCDVQVSAWLAPADLRTLADKAGELADRHDPKTEIASAGTIRDGKITQTVGAAQHADVLAAAHLSALLHGDDSPADRRAHVIDAIKAVAKALADADPRFDRHVFMLSAGLTYAQINGPRVRPGPDADPVPWDPARHGYHGGLWMCPCGAADHHSCICQPAEES